ncbi:DNA cytosine methyltransferase [Agrobacterium rosae]|uniref:DNA (cytosine-5-)-methyltransferase n=1 Tax=Agrobacterium rosae TaxID=1972867 RepID=A0AAW9FLY1_9HYPH|nr:DNA cytosine methyltransferase [Agrobacterium rosae]MDX8305592.1 DNA cytosine methyltransferase [Agrobacterium rosae]
MQYANDNHTGLRFLSVCSGIEAASVAWHPLGWKAVAFSEIEKFPSAVLKHHYPDVPNLGDFTNIDTQTLGRVDILAGGTPCQAFSVAGLRQGLGDARGNLTLKFVELAHELANGNGLRNVVWENVVGVLSDKGNAFGCFLAGLVGADSAIEPPRRGKWARHGMVSGPKGRAAWAVKDGQFFGVAQRRRRVLVVADFGDGADPAAVLFEPESMFRDTPPSREAGKDIAPTISARTKGGGGLGTDFDLDGGLVRHSVDVAPCLRAGGNSTGGDRPYGTDADTADSLIAYTPKVARCDATREGSPQDYGNTTMVAVAGTLCKDSFSGGMGGRPEGAAAGHFIAQSVALRGRNGGATAELGGCQSAFKSYQAPSGNSV